MPTGDLSYIALDQDCIISNKNGTTNLFSRFLRDLQTIFGDNFISKVKHQQKSLSSSHYDQIWKSILVSSAKGEFYYKFKHFIKLKPYLTLVQNRKQRVSCSKLRLCDHKLNIEVLRHQKFKVPRDQRTCPLCFNECEDEIHYLVVINYVGSTSQLNRSWEI